MWAGYGTDQACDWRAAEELMDLFKAQKARALIYLDDAE
jgi:hypothetical protein